MPKLRTHYDNLKVPREAPQEVIRAAYRTLSQKYHPDRNSSPDAARIMRLLNQAYSVLSDPERRAEHDEWIDAQVQKRKDRPDTERLQAVIMPPHSEHALMMLACALV